MSPTFSHILGQTCFLSILGIFWLLIGVFIFKQFFVRGRVAIREKGFRLEGAIDLNPDRYEYPVTHSIKADSSLEIRNTTAHTVRVCPRNKDKLVTPVFSLQRPEPERVPLEAHSDEITLAAGQSGWVTFEFGGDYNLTAHSLDGVAFPYNRLIVHVSATPVVVITEQGFLVAGTISDLRSARYTQPAGYSIKTDVKARFKNLSPLAVSLCQSQAAGLQEVLTLAPGQSSALTLNTAGDYEFSVYAPGYPPFSYPQLVVHVEDSD